jgi:hypothetical protein
VTSLNAAGFETSTICVFLPPTHPVADEVRSVKSSSGELSQGHEYDPGDKSTGPLANLGIPSDAAMRYEARTREDASLVFVRCDGSAQSEWAREILRLLRAEEVCVLGEQLELECDPPSADSNLIMFRPT